jgi:hypothetical protein
LMKATVGALIPTNMQGTISSTKEAVCQMRKSNH